MPYDDNFEYNTDNSMFDNDDLNDVGFEEISGLSSESTPGVENTLRSGDSIESDVDYSADYTTYLDDIIANQESIIANQESIIANQDSLLVYEQNISDNSFRLYYFIGGLYVAFAIVIMIKFFKTFLF